MNVIRKSFLSLLLIGLVVAFANAQTGKSKATASRSVFFELKPLWGKQIDPRWRAGNVIGDVEDGITVEFVEFSADGKSLVTGNGQGQGFILDVSNGTVIRQFTYITREDVNHINKEIVSNISGGLTKSLEVECGTFTPDGRYVVFGGNLNGIKVFDLSDGSLFKHIEYSEVKEEVDGLSVSSDGRFFAYASLRSAKIFGIDGWEMIKSVEYTKGERGTVVNSIDFTKDGGFIVMAGNAGHVPLVNTENWQKYGEGRIPAPTSIKSVRLSPDENLVAAGYSGGEVVVWNTWNMALVNQFSSLTYIEAVAWNSDGRFLFAGGRDDGEGRMLVFRTRDWQMVGNPEVMADGASIEYIDVYGDLVAVCGEDGHVRLFRMKYNN